jgi:chromatin modification-related protein YNG2
LLAAFIGCAEIQLEINKESAKFFKQQLRGAGIGKDNVAAKIAADYATLSTLADEKRVLAERLAALVGRTRSRLDHDIQRMFTLTGEDPTLRTNYPSLNLGGPTPMSAVVENIRTALVPAEPVPAASVSVQPPPNKRRCCARFCMPLHGPLTRSIRAGRRPTVATPKQASPAPVSASSGRHGHGRARNSPMAPRRRAPVSEAMSEEIEDDERADDDPEEEDNRLYCFCQSKSFGEVRVSISRPSAASC